MKKQLLACAMALLASLPLIAGGQSEKTAQQSSGEKVYKIGVSKLLPHPALDKVEQGLQDYLATTGLKVSFDLQNANGDISTVNSITQKFKSDKDDLVVGIATPSAQSLANTFSDIPVVYSAVTDPNQAGLDTGLVCGVSDMNSVESQIQLLVKVTKAQAIGNIYCSSEANGVVQMEQAKAACEKLGVTFVGVAVNNTSEVKMAVQSIIDRVDAIYIATDNAVISAFPAVDEVCNKAKKGLFTSDPSVAPDSHFLIAWGCDYYAIGISTGKVIEQCLKGTDPRTIGDNGAVYMTNTSDIELWLNLDQAKKLGYTFSDDVLKDAAVLIQDGKQVSKK
ncbi:MAG: ABC transporter substrate-binding protein [Spirochaetaceae bacterium]|nr:ABC transporter substrate-binding protein [Spirochaetaceae bacterium]